MRKTSLVALLAALILVLLSAGAVVAYDRTQNTTIAAGVSVGGVSLGGLDAKQATSRLLTQYVEPLRRTVVVRAADRRFRLSAREAKTQANVKAMVAHALQRSRDGNVVTRTWRSVTGGELDAEITPRVDYSRDAVSRLVDRVRVQGSRPARDAEVSFAADTVSVKESRTGRVVNTRTLRANVEAALSDLDRSATVKVSMRTVKPKVTTAKLAKRYPTIVTVDRGSFKLRLFKRLKLVKTYGIAVGAVGLETPAGVYPIANKAVNPAWSVPNSAWAGDLAGTVVPPGPSNPIKARWMGLIDGAGIHGTDARGSIGSNASHGCIRMLVEDVEELYDRVRVGTPVHIA